MSEALAYLAGIEQLANEKSSTKRRELLNAVTDIFLITHDNQTDADSKMFGDVMERIAYELEVEARAQLSQKICESQRISRRLVVRMANDDIAVARPVLERSTILNDGDLVDIIRNRSDDHHYSIAGRKQISTNVSGELVDHGNDRTLNRVTGNQGAEFTQQSLEKIVGRARENSELRDTLGSRTDVPAELLEKVKSKVADRMKSELQESHGNLDEDFIGALVERCAEEIDLDYSQESMLEIERSHQAGELQEETISRLAREKRLPDVVHCLSLFTGLNDWSVSQCLLKAELQALAILCKANDFKSPTFLALAECRTSEGNLKSATLAKAMREYENLDTATAQRIMRFLKVRLKLQQQQQTQNQDKT